MKLLALFGSPRRKGNTAALLNAFLKAAEDKGEVEVEFINLQERIKSCKLQIVSTISLFELCYQ